MQNINKKAILKKLDMMEATAEILLKECREMRELLQKDLIQNDEIKSSGIAAEARAHVRAKILK